MTPYCPIHRGAQMRLVNSAAPLFHCDNANRSSKGKYRVEQADKRMIWRCPAEGCPRVEAWEGENRETPAE